VLDALIALGDGLDWPVIDGSGVSEDYGFRYVMIGVEDPDNDEAALAVEVQQEWLYIGGQSRQEDGTVSCCAVAWSGDSGGGDNADAAAKPVRDQAYEQVAAFEQALRATPDLGVDGLLWAELRTGSLSQWPTDTGTIAFVFFQVHYRAHI
jgi:hypothetical protein